MKELLKKVLVVSSIIIATVFGISWIFFGYTEAIGLIFKIMLLAFIVVILQKYLHRIPFKYYLLNLTLEYMVICAVVLLAGIIFRWFVRSNWWMVFLYVGIVFIIGYFLDLVTIKKDLAFINQKLVEWRKTSNENKVYKQ